MKKFFIVFLITSLFIGCASKPKAVEVEMEKPSTTKLTAPYAERWQEQKRLEEETGKRYKWFSNKDGTVYYLSPDDPWIGYNLNNIYFWSWMKQNDSDLCYQDLNGRPGFDWYPDNVTCENPEKKPYLVRLTNNTDRDVVFWLVHKFNFEFRPDYFVKITVPAHSTKYVKSKVTEKTTSFGVGVDSIDGWGNSLGHFGVDYFHLGDDLELSARVIDELLKFYCIEAIFNEEINDDNWNNNSNIVRLVKFPESYDEEDLIEANWAIR